MTDQHLEGHIESLIFLSRDEITVEEIAETLSAQMEATISRQEVENAISRLVVRYSEGPYAFHIVPVSGGYKFMTKGIYHDTIATYLKLTTKKKLSSAAIETLSIIAYKQPVTKSELEAIRGVNCDYSIQKLLEKDLVEITGRSDGPGRPLIYNTSKKFMDYFGLKDLSDLPKLKDFDTPESEIGEKAPIEEDILSGQKWNKKNE